MSSHLAGISKIFSGFRQRHHFSLPLATCLSLLLTTTLGNEFISRKISGSSPDFMDIAYAQYEFSPDGHYVVFVADRTTDDKFELYSVPATGRTPTHISGAITPANGYVHDFAITPNSHFVVYTANMVSVDQTNLYCVPITGGVKPEQLNKPAHSHSYVQEFKISPDGQHIVYHGDEDTHNENELYSVPIDGLCRAAGNPVKLNDPIVPAFGIIDMWKISPDSQRVVYRADQEVYFRKELYSVPITGGTVAKLNDALIEDGFVSEFHISPNSQKVVYSAVQETLGVAELYSVPINNVGTKYKLNPDILTGSGVRKFEVTPNSAGVVYIADQNMPYVDELYAVPITGGTIKKLNGILVANGDVNDFLITPNSEGVVYRADATWDGYEELYSNYITGGPPYRLDDNLPALGRVYNFEITPNNAGVVFMWQPPGETSFRLYSNWITGGTPIRLDNVTGVVSHFEIASNSLRVVYEEDSGGVVELYSVSSLGGPVEKLNSPLVSGGTVEGFRIGPDSQNVIFKSDLEQDEKFELYLSVKASHSYLPDLQR